MATKRKLGALPVPNSIRALPLWVDVDPEPEPEYRAARATVLLRIGELASALNYRPVFSPYKLQLFWTIGNGVKVQLSHIESSVVFKPCRHYGVMINTRRKS